MRNRPEWLEVMLGSYEARVAPFNVNYRYVEDELVQVLQAGSPRAVVFEALYAPAVTAAVRKVPGCDLLVQVPDESGNPLADGALDYEDAIATMNEHPQPAGPVSPDDLYLLFTGGKTGVPKAVAWRQADIFVAGMNGRVPRSDAEFTSMDELLEHLAPKARASLPATPLMHGSAQWNALATLFNGGTVVMQDILDHLDPDDIWRTIERHKVKVLVVAGNAVGRPLLDALASGTYDTSGLRLILTGAVAMSVDIKRQLIEALPQVTIVDTAGASESGTALIQRSSAETTIESGTFAAAPGACVLDEERRVALSPGDTRVGWLARRGRVPLGYLNDPENTLKTFPEIDGQRMTVPGDRASLSSTGSVVLLGRDSATINTGGEKVFAEEVEDAIGRHPAVYDVVVASRPSERWGAEIGAVVQVRPGTSVDLEEIQTVAGAHLARYKLPKTVVFVDQVKRSAAGKADYRWAEAVLAAGFEPTP
jgi:acyl-CoA synthetase (AMP-forming)/AMP-acid ligase II